MDRSVLSPLLGNSCDKTGILVILRDGDIDQRSSLANETLVGLIDCFYASSGER